MDRIKLTITVALVLAAACSLNWAAELRLDSAGVRSGFSTRPSNDRFMQTEVFSDLNLPWTWNWGKRWRWNSQLELSAGWLHRQRADAFVGSLGPQLCLRRTSFPLELVGGASLTCLSRSAFGEAEWDFGSPLQFTSHIGLRWQPGRHWEFGYRLQHMSNGGFSHPNPGLNLHMLLVGWRF